MTISLAYDETLSRVRITYTGAPAGANVVRVERSPNQITWTAVRGGAHATLTAGGATVDDYEFTANTTNYYRVTPLLFADFSSGVALEVTGTWHRDNARSHSGQWAYRSANIGENETSEVDITIPASATEITLWYSVSSELVFDVFYLEAADGTRLVTDSGVVPWTSVVFDVATVGATLTAGYTKDPYHRHEALDSAFLDDVVIHFPAEGSTQITPVLESVWLKVIARPYLNQAITITEVGEVERPARNGIFSVLGRSVPVAVTEVRGSRRWSITVMLDTPDAAEDFDYTLTTGDPVFVHVPPGCGLPRSMYAVIGDTTMSRKTVRGARRYVELPLTEVAAPAPSIVGATVIWADIVATFATWTDLVAAEATWQDVNERITDPSVVVTP